jgi:hypothetical protein
MNFFYFFFCLPPGRRKRRVWGGCAKVSNRPHHPQWYAFENEPHLLRFCPKEELFFYYSKTAAPLCATPAN